MTKVNEPTYEGRYSVIFRELERLKADTEVTEAENQELQQVEELRRIVAEVETESPRFMTST